MMGNVHLLSDLILGQVLHSLDLVNSNEADSLGLSLEMTEISDHSGSVDDIVQVKLRDGGVHLLKQHRQGLPPEQLT